MSPSVYPYQSFYRSPSSFKLPDRNSIGWSEREETTRMEICPDSKGSLETKHENLTDHGALKHNRPLKLRPVDSLVRLVLARLISFSVTWSLVLARAFLWRRAVNHRINVRPRVVLRERRSRLNNLKKCEAKTNVDPLCDQEGPGTNLSLYDGVFSRVRGIHLPNKPGSLKGLVQLVVMALVTPLVKAQYTEMLAWITGSTIDNVGTGPGNSYPQSRYQHGSFYDPTLKFFYVFGGKLSTATYNDFWRYSLTSGAWTLLSSVASLTVGNTGSYGTIGQESSSFLPSPRYEFGNTYDSQNRWFFLFGGYNGGGLWRYSVTGNTWALLSGSKTLNQPGILPTSAGFYGTESSSYLPGARTSPSLGFDSLGKFLYMYGGFGFSRTAGSIYLDELWRFSIVTRRWAFLSGTVDSTSVPIYGVIGTPASNNYPGSRSPAFSFFDPKTGAFFIGFGTLPAGRTNEVWRYNPTDRQWAWISGSNVPPAPDPYASFPALGAEATQPAPSRRADLAFYFNATTSTLFIAGGFGNDITGSSGHMGDIWRFNIATLNWAFIGGETGVRLLVTFGNRGIESSTDSSMGTFYGAVLFQNNNRLYLHYGYTSSGCYSAIVTSRIICPAAQYWSNFLCYPCTGSMLTQVIDGQSSCVACPENWQCYEGKLSCSPGFTYSATGCVGCSAGTYKNIYGTQPCAICPVNSVCSSTGFTCFEGFYDSGGDCLACAAGFYKSVAGNQKCTRCPLNAVCTTTTWSCNAGFYYNGVGCVACAADSYKSEIGNQGCTKCPANAVCYRTSLSCNAGFYLSGSSCLACRSGTYKSLSGNELCTDCPTNWLLCTTTSFTCTFGYSSDGTSCFPCEEGTYRNVITDQLCSPCPLNSVDCTSTSFSCDVGYYSTGTSCLSCAAGTYKSVRGIQACTNCPLNSACTATEFTCNAGYYLSGARCLACGTGTYKDIPGNQGCTSCPLISALCTTTYFTCKAGYFFDGASCVACEPGNYKSVTGNQACTICPLNAVCSSTSFTCQLGFFFDVNRCVACSAGTYKDVIGNQACTRCPLNSASCATTSFTCNPGYFSTGTSCVDCKTGTSTNISGSQACLNCPIGSYASGSSDNQACTICPSGSYSDVPGSISCTVCPPGATCSTTSLTCNPGFFKDNINTCTICPVNTFKDTAGNDLSSCLTCPSNFFSCNSTTLVCDRGFERVGAMCSPCSTSPSMYKPLVGNQACSSCPAGATCNSTDFTCLEGRSQTGSSCSVCPGNMYKDLKGNNDCLSCPIGATCSSIDFTCLEGHYQTGSSCSMCPVNMYKDWKGNNACLSCPIGASCVDSASFVCLTGYRKTGNNCTAISHAPTDAAVERFSCPTGAICNEAGFTCTAGYYQSDTLCLPCESNTFKSFDGNLQACLLCPEAATCTRTDFTCHSGYFRSGNNCSACPANMFKSTPGNEACSSCPSNAVCDTRSFICNTGFSAAGSVCSPCASGFYKPEASNGPCLMCPSDSTCNSTMFQCNAGYSASNGGCSPCSDGFYKPFIGNKQCLACPSNSSCDQTSFSCFPGYFEDGSVCNPCQEGTYNNKIGAKYCSPCPKYATCSSTSFVCQTGFNKRELSCADCPQGSFKETDGTCGLCPSNSLCESDIFFCYPGYTKLGKGCIPCVPNKYKGFIGNDACLNCPIGAVCDGTHFTCAPGYQLFLRVCVSCSTNTFKPSIGNTSCLVCPDDASCNTTAITACPPGYQPDESECQQVFKGTNTVTASSLGPMYVAIIGGIGGLLCVLCLVLVIYYVRSRAQTKAALEFTRTSMSQLDNRSLARGGTLRTFTESQTAINRSFSGSSTALNSVPTTTNSVPTATYSGSQLNNKPGPVGTSTSSTLEFGGRTFVSKTPDFLEVTENQHYSRVKKISEGAMGEVWLSHASQPALVQRADSYKCVIKVVKPQAKVSWEVFQQEVTISYHIREHTNIAQIIGFSRSPFIIVLRYYPQGSLESLLYKRQMKGFSWSVAWSRSFALDIAQGLSHMHKLSIAHCDIKPDNILMKFEKDSLLALLSDFGISRILDGQTSAVAGFQTHNLNGISMRYAGPETIVRFRRRGGASVNQPQIIKAGDVYSLAIVLYEMLTREKPWLDKI